MRADLTDITMVIDRSGSMSSIRTDAEGGINTFIEQQKQGVGEALLTLVQFDTEYEFIHRGVAIGVVPRFELIPRGSTALLDAVGRAINETGARLAAMPEPERAGLVAFVIVTDGLENSSREFTRERIRQMIEHQQSAYQWQFTFLAANQDAFAEGDRLGIARSGVANFSPDHVQMAYHISSEKMARMRKAHSEGRQVDNNFTDEERKRMQ